MEESDSDDETNSRCFEPAKREVVSALYRYLIEKGLEKKDAYSVSVDSPGFVRKLMAARMADDSCQRESVHEWLLRTGINIMEPFIESIGMDPERVDDVLPLVQVDLMGEQGLLRTTKVLRNLGIGKRTLWHAFERNKQLLTLTGAELQEVVDFLDGLGVKRKDMARLVENSYLLTEYLATLQQLRRFGAKKYILTDILKTELAVDMPVGSLKERMNFLLSSGLSKEEVRRSLRLFPQLLHLRLENLKRKIQFFDSIGLERGNVAKIIDRWPSVFRESAEKKMRPKVELLQSLGVGRDGIAKILSRYPELTGASLEENLKQKVAFFESNGLVGRRLVKLMTSHPRALTLSINDLNKKLVFLKEQGFASGSVEMVRALGACITISLSSLQSRFLNMESLGFSRAETRSIIRQQPTLLTVSEKCVKEKVQFLVQNMGRSTHEVIKCPCYLLYSLELRIKPRHRVLSLLKSEGLLREEAYMLSTIMIMSEKRFVERFVSKHPAAMSTYKFRGDEALGEKREVKEQAKR